MAEQKIPFNRASFTGTELTDITRAVENGHISGDGAFTERCHRLLEKESGAARALLTTSCTLGVVLDHRDAVLAGDAGRPGGRARWPRSSTP